MDVRLAKFRGEFLWHRHDAEDELFLVCRGVLLMRLRDGELRLGPREFVVVPRGTEHCPAAEGEECSVMTFSPSTLLNTENVAGERTVRELGRISPAARS